MYLNIMNTTWTIMLIPYRDISHHDTDWYTELSQHVRVYKLIHYWKDLAVYGNGIGNGPLREIYPRCLLTQQKRLPSVKLTIEQQEWSAVAPQIKER